MPLKKGRCKKTISKNISGLMKKPPKARSKGGNNLAKKLGVTKKEAQRRQAVAIALNAAGKSRKK